MKSKSDMMRMNTRHGMALMLAMLLALPMMAQKQFTLEDLNFGGNNYRNMIPQSRSLTWWGDQLVRLSNDTCWTINPVNGKEKVLFTRERLNKGAGLTVDSLEVKRLSMASFPYPGKPLVMLYNQGERLLVNFKTRKVEWRMPQSGFDAASEWNEQSRAEAYVKGDNKPAS